MSESLAKKLVGSFSGLLALGYGKQLIVFIISLLPLLELRGGLIAASLLNMDPLESYIISIIGNVIPVPFILLFIESVMKWMRSSRIGFISRFAACLDKKVGKNKKNIEKYGFWGLALFVGIPLPGTGAWTGCLIAAMLHMKKSTAFAATLTGVFIASIIMMAVSVGIIGNIIR